MAIKSEFKINLKTNVFIKKKYLNKNIQKNI